MLIGKISGLNKWKKYIFSLSNNVILIVWNTLCNFCYIYPLLVHILVSCKFFVKIMFGVYSNVRTNFKLTFTPQRGSHFCAVWNLNYFNYEFERTSDSQNFAFLAVWLCLAAPILISWKLTLILKNTCYRGWLNMSVYHYIHISRFIEILR